MLTNFGNRWMTFSPASLEALGREFERRLSVDRRNGFQRAPLSLWEDDKNVYLEIDVPGFTKENLDVIVEKGKLFIRGLREQPERNGKSWYDERRYGRFERVIALADTIDPGTIDANVENGVLHVTLAKKPELQPHRINVKCSGGRK